MQSQPHRVNCNIVLNGDFIFWRCRCDAPCERTFSRSLFGFTASEARFDVRGRFVVSELGSIGFRAVWHINGEVSNRFFKYLVFPFFEFLATLFLNSFAYAMGIARNKISSLEWQSSLQTCEGEQPPWNCPAGLWFSAVEPLLRWLRRHNAPLLCWIGLVSNQYFAIACTHHPTPVPPIRPYCMAHGF